MGLIISRLKRTHRAEHFDCTDAALNDYIRKYAWQNQVRYRVGVTYVAAEETQQDLVIGYYTLASSSIPRDVFPSGSRFGPYEHVPAVLLGRLAVDRTFHGRGVGEALLADALDRALALRQHIGCRCVIVDAYPAAVSWYEKYGFTPLPAPGDAPARRMFIDLRTVQKAKA